MTIFIELVPEVADSATFDLTSSAGYAIEFCAVAMGFSEQLKPASYRQYVAE
jgi:hypothetical protein